MLRVGKRDRSFSKIKGEKDNQGKIKGNIKKCFKYHPNIENTSKQFRSF